MIPVLWDYNLMYIGIQVERFCPASLRETCQWLKFPLDGLRAQSRVSPVVGLLLLAAGLAYLGMSFPSCLVKQLYRCDSVVISSFVTTEYTTRRWGWLLRRIGYSITHHNSGIHLDRLQNKCTNCKGAKNNTNFGQITGIQEKLGTTCT